MAKLPVQLICVLVGWIVPLAQTEPVVPGLIDPDVQPMFEVECINAMDPDFAFDSSSGYLEVGIGEGVVETGLVDEYGKSLQTPVWGYGQNDGIGYTWPGRTIHARCHVPLRVKWSNELGTEYLLTGLYNGKSVVDTSIHWAYSLHGYGGYSIERDGVPVVVSYNQHAFAAF